MMRNNDNRQYCKICILFMCHEGCRILQKHNYLQVKMSCPQYEKDSLLQKKEEEEKKRTSQSYKRKWNSLKNGCQKLLFHLLYTVHYILLKVMKIFIPSLWNVVMLSDDF